MTHQNSTAALKEITESGSKRLRMAAILSCYRGGKVLTDRQVLNRLFRGSDNLNLVRPRISEAVETLKTLWQVDSIKCPTTGRKVRRCALVSELADLFEWSV